MKRRTPQIVLIIALAMLAIASQSFLPTSDVSATSTPPATFGRENNLVTQERFASASYYRLTTKWQGGGKSLDILNDGTNNRPILAVTGNYTGQYWRITPLAGGYYRLTTEWQGAGKSLDVVNDGKTNNQIILAKTGKFSGQSWKITPVGEGYYRLTTEWQGDGKSLDVVNDGKDNNQLILAVKGNFTGQFWKITKVK